MAIFKSYLADIVQEILLAHPDALKSGKQLTVEEVLAQGGWKQIISYLVEREAEEVENDPFPEVIKYFNSRFNRER